MAGLCITTTNILLKEDIDMSLEDIAESLIGESPSHSQGSHSWQKEAFETEQGEPSDPIENDTGIQTNDSGNNMVVEENAGHFSDDISVQDEVYIY